MNTQLRVVNFSKQFRSHWTFQPVRAVEDVSFEVNAGEAFGFIGHNGAGKTTTIKSILGLVKQTSGTIEFEGKPLRDSRARAAIGYLPELPYFYDHLTVVETLTYFATLYGQERFNQIGIPIAKAVAEVIERLSLGPKRNAPLRSLSKGLQQRVGFAQAILHRPKLLLLDEPFSGLDPLGRVEFRNIILELNRGGTTIFLSSHILSDVEAICNRVAIMAKGRLRAVISPTELASNYGQRFELVLGEVTAAVKEELAKQCNVTEELAPTKATILRLSFTNYDQAAAVLGKATAQCKVLEFKTVSPSLEEVFLKITEQSKSSG